MKAKSWTTTFAAFALVGLSCLTGGFAALSASAEQPLVSVAPSSLFTENAAVETVSEVRGLHVKGSATLQGVCKGETTIEYYLPAKYGGAVFEVCDTDGDLVYSVYSRWRGGAGGINNGGAFVGYDDTYYLVDGSTLTKETLKLEAIGYGALPDPGYMAADGLGTLKFNAVSNGKVTVKMSYNTKGIIDLATLTLSQEDAAALSDGYVVKLRGYTKSDPIPTDHPSNVLITKINGADVTGTSVGVSYTNCNITYDDTYNPEVTVNGVSEIAIDAGESLAPFAVEASGASLGSLQLGTIPLAESVTYSEDFSQKPAGTYDITVTHALGTKNYKVRVVDPILYSVSALVQGDDMATVKTAYTETYENGSYSGVYVNGSAQFVGTFYGDFEMEYVFPAGKLYGISAIGVCDLDGNEKFYVGRTWQNGGLYASSGGAYVYDATANKYYTNLSSEIIELEKIISKNLASNILPAYNHPETAGKLYLQWDGNSIIVKADVLSGGTRVLAQIPAEGLKDGYKVVLRSQPYSDKTVFENFSGSASPFIVGAVNGTSLAGDKAKISYGADILSYQGSITDNVIYLPQNGVFENFTAKAYRVFGVDWREDCAVNDIRFTPLGNFNVAVAGTYTDVGIRPELNDRYGTVKTYDVVVESSYKITFDANGGEEIADWYYSANTWNRALPTPVRRYWKFGGWEENGTPVTALPQNNQRALNLKAVWIDDVAPIVSLNVDAVVTRQKGEGLGVSKTDVTAVDAVSGTLTQQAVSIFIKAPNATDYVAFETFTLNPDLYGAYDVRYIVKDGADNQTVVERKIQYTAIPPVVTLKGEVPATGLTYQTIALPLADAKVGNTSIEYSISITINGERITVTNHTFKPVKAGTYSVIYAATDSTSGQIASKEFTIVISEDLEKPFIDVNFDVTRITLGEKITLPTATATDNVAKNLTVSVEIKRGVDVVATGEYTPEEVGIYSVVYTVSDESGNTQTLTFEVLVSAGDNTDHNWTGQTPESDSVGGGTSAGNSGAQTDGCGASIGGGITAVSTLLAAAVLMKKKNKKQTEKGDK